MKTVNLAKLRKKIEKTLESKRYEHTLSVAYTAANLAAVHGVDVEKALVAGMLHDCAKCLGHRKQISICKKNHVLLSELEMQKDSKLLHAKSGSILAKEYYGITDQDILSAICYHTTGRPHMSQLEKIIYIADYIEPGRKRAKKAEEEDLSLLEVRKLAFQDLDGALRKILHDTLGYLSQRGGSVDPMTQKTYEYYLKCDSM